MKNLSCFSRGLSGALLLIMLLASATIRAQAPSWQAAYVGSGGVVNETVPDGNGNVYLLGGFSSMTFSFGGLTFQNGDTHSPGAEIFLIKWNTATNTAVWGLQSRGMGGSINATGLAVSGTSVYVTGVIFGSRTFGGTTIANAKQVVFIDKLTDAGTSASSTWAQYITPAATSNYSLTPLGKKSAVAVSGANVYLAGQFKGTVSLGATTMVSNGGGAGGTDGFLAKLVDAGASSSVVWAQSFGGTGDEVTQTLALSGTDLYVGGWFEGTDVIGTTSLTNAGGRDGYVAKFVDAGTTGTFAWASSMGGTAADEVVSVAANSAGAYVTGHFTTAAAAGTTSLTSAGLRDGFVGKLAAADGRFVWSKSFGGAGFETVGGLAVLGANVYASGTFAGPASFGTTTLTSTGQYDIFVARLTDAGPTSAFAWVQQVGCPSYNPASNTVSVTPAAVLYVGGTCGSGSVFGTISPAGTGAFIASITDAAALATKSADALGAWQLYPNPAHAHVVMQLPAVAGAATLTLLDALGRPVRTEALALSAVGQRHDLDLTGLPAGLYAVRVQAGGSTATRRLVVE
ncbi:MAG: hypothetical protein JWP58_772 [Hymenobacter sp.]|nr:hypothetical protein [Hymenobacter sp.]